MEQEKIKAPQGWLDQRNEEAGRRQLIGEWGDYLKGQQRKAIDEEGASSAFKTKIPLDVMKSLTDSEREFLAAAEKAEYDRSNLSPNPSAHSAPPTSRPAAMERSSTRFGAPAAARPRSSR